MLWAIGLTRAVPWMVEGAVIGAAIGILRRDKFQMLRGAFGGIIGGAIGGLLTDGMLQISYTDATFSLAGGIGLIITGALIGLFLRVAQDALKDAWCIGITPGDYYGKEYPLNTERITIGCSELNDIALFHKSDLPVQNGAFVRQGSLWSWEGEAVLINGALQTQAVLSSGDVLRFGSNDFRFMLRRGDVRPELQSR